MSSSTLDAIIPIMLELAETKSPISQAAGAAVEIKLAVNRVKGNKAAFAGLGEDAIKLLYVVEEELREKGQKKLDDKTRGDLHSLTEILEKILDLAQKNAAMSDRKAFWHSDEDVLQILREELQQLLPTFGFMSFADLEIKSEERIKDMGDNTDQGITESEPDTIRQRDGGMSSTSHRAQILPGANNPFITGGEFNIVGRDYNSRSYGAWY